MRANILAAFADRPYQPFSPYAIWRILQHGRPDLTLNNVRVTIHRLYVAGKLRKRGRGLYQDPSSFIEDTAIDPSIQLHNLHLKYDCNKQTPYGFRRLRQIVTTRFASPFSGISPSNKSYVANGLDWNGRSLTIQLTTRKNLLVEMSSSWNPLNWLDVVSFFKGWLPGAFDIPLELWTVTMADFNIDEGGRLVHHRIVQEISVSEFTRAILRFYQKAVDRVRTEVGMTAPSKADRFLRYAESIVHHLVGLYGPELDGNLAEVH